MYSPSHVVVATTGGARGAEAARVGDQLAKLYGATMELFSGVEEAGEVDARRGELQRLIHETGVTAEAHVGLESDAPEEFIEEIAARGLICMATSAKLTRHDGHFGSYAERTLRAARHPVVLLGPRTSKGIDAVDRVVVAVDGSELAERAVPLGASIAERLGVNLWVVTVVTPDVQRASAAAGVVHEAGYVRRLAEPHAAQYEVLHGDDVPEAIVTFAGTAGLIVTTTHGATGLRRLVTGSVAMGIVADSHAPIVVVPPQFSTDPDAEAVSEQKGAV
jgi:nucleotide-binding universal stress UspA family protein